MKARRRMVAALLAAGAAAWAGPAGAQGVPEAAKKEGKVVWYSSLALEVGQKICNLFTQRHPGVPCELMRSGSERIVQRILQETKANLAIADVMETSDAAHFLDFKQRGLLQPYQPEGTKSMRGDLRDAEHFYHTLRGTPYVIAYNTRLVTKDGAPRKWQDVLDPKWKGKVAHGHPGYSGVVTTGMVGILGKYGWEYYTALAKNQPVLGQSAEDPPIKVAGGEASVGVSGAYNFFKSRRKGNPIDIVFPADLVPFVNSPVALLKRAPHPNAAKLFLDFLYSRDAQQIMADDGVVPMNDAVALLSGGVAMKDLKNLVVPDAKEIIKINEEIKVRFRELFGV